MIILFLLYKKSYDKSDKETGIILYLALYDQNGMSKVIIDTIDIWINKEVPDDVFQLF